MPTSLTSFLPKNALSVLAGCLLRPQQGSCWGRHWEGCSGTSTCGSFWVAAGLCLANVVLYGAFVMPESLTKDRRVAFSMKKASPIGALRFLAGRPAVASLALVYAMLLLAAQCMPNTIVLYTDYRFAWSAGQIGAYLTVVGIANMLVQAFVLKRFVRRFGEHAAVIVGFTCYTMAFLIYASAPMGAVFVLAAPFFALGSLVTPSVQAQVTRKVAENEQGRLQGHWAQ